VQDVLGGKRKDYGFEAGHLSFYLSLKTKKGDAPADMGDEPSAKRRKVDGDMDVRGGSYLNKNPIFNY
jgi:hypothetical protein